MSAPRWRAEDGALSLRLGRGWRATTPALLGLSVVLVLNAAVALLVTLPLWRAAAAEGAVERTALQATRTLEPALEAARDDYGRILEAERDLVALRAHIAGRSGSVSEVVSTLRAAIDGSGLRADRTNYQPGEVEELGLERLRVDLPVRGSYAQLRAFLDRLLSGPIFAIVERIGATSPSTSDTSGGLQMNLTLSVFLADEDVPAPFAFPDPVAATSPERLTGVDPVVVAEQLRARLTRLPAIPLEDEAFALRLVRLDAPSPESGPSRRNLFDFAYVPPPPRPERENRPPREVAPPPEPVMPYDLLGVIRTWDGLMATLSDDRDVYNVVEGDRLPTGMRVTKITLVDVTLQSGRRETVLSLRKEDDIEAGSPRREPRTKGGSGSRDR